MEDYRHIPVSSAFFYFSSIKILETPNPLVAQISIAEAKTKGVQLGIIRGSVTRRKPGETQAKTRRRPGEN
jgi:hypothetical protein